MREHPRHVSKIAEGKGKSSQLHNVVNSWRYDLMKAKSPWHVALEKSKDRRERKASKREK